MKTGSKHKETSWRDRNILYFGWDVSYTGVFLCQNSYNSNLKTCAFLCLQSFHHFKIHPCIHACMRTYIKLFSHPIQSLPALSICLLKKGLKSCLLLLIHFTHHSDPSGSSSSASVLGPGEEREVVHFLLRKGH